MQGFEEAPTNVLQYFVERADDPVFAHKNEFKSQVKALLETRRNDVADKTLKLSEESVALGKEGLTLSVKTLVLTKFVLWVSVVAAAAALIQLFIEFHR